MKNKVKAKLNAGQAVSGPIIGEVMTVGPVKVLANAGHDYLWFDMEHSFCDWETLHTLVQYSLAVGITPLVRVTDLSYQLVARALDTGAHGVVIPRVDTAAQAREAVQLAKYPPMGRRGAGGLARVEYQPLTDVKAVVDNANAETLVVVQVETPQAVGNLDEIAAVDGVDVICIGPHDLSINLGVHGDYADPLFVATVTKIAETCGRHGKTWGMVSTDASAFQQWYDLGCRFFACNSDLSLISQQATRDVKVLKAITGQ